MKRISAKATPSPAMIVAMIALIVALSGSAYAAVTINGKNIKKGTVTSKQIKDKTVTSTDIKNGTIKAADLSSGLSTAGPKGDQGAPGTARAYAQVVKDGPAFIAERTKGFTAVRRESTGSYCLLIDPALGIDPAKVAAVVSPEFGSSSVITGSAQVRGINTNNCNANEFSVHTLNGGSHDNGISFDIIVP